MILGNMMFRKLNGVWVARRSDWQFELVEGPTGWTAKATRRNGDVETGRGSDAASALVMCLRATIAQVDRSIAEMDARRRSRRYGV